MLHSHTHTHTHVLILCEFFYEIGLCTNVGNMILLKTFEMNIILVVGTDSGAYCGCMYVCMYVRMKHFMEERQQHAGV